MFSTHPPFTNQLFESFALTSIGKDAEEKGKLDPVLSDLFVNPKKKERGPKSFSA